MCSVHSLRDLWPHGSMPHVTHPILRIALIAPFGLRAKGTARARCLPLGKALAQRGHEVTLFVPPYDSPADDGLCWTEDGVAVVNVALPPALGVSALGQAAWHARLGWRTYRAVTAWRPQVVHAFKPKGPSGLAATLLWLARRAEHPRLVVDSDDWEGPGGWNDDARAAYSGMQRRFFAWQERYGLTHADAWTVASECLCERTVAFGAPPAQVHVLHNGLSDFGRQLLVSEAAGQAGPSALLYTRFAGVEPEEVATLWAKVRGALPEARLTVVGRGVGGEEQALGGVPGVTMAGWHEPAELPALFARHRLALVPWADSPANRARHSAKVLELMAAGLPLVAYGVGELPATLGEAGVIVPAADRRAFAGEVVALLQDPMRAAQLGAAARARVAARFNWDTLADIALSAYGCAE
jgi:glycosyltransferase involved in cell wall biosynthesis